MQRKDVRIIAGIQISDLTNDLFLNFRILKLVNLVELRTAIIMLKAYNNMLPNNVQNFFTSNMCNQYNTRL